MMQRTLRLHRKAVENRYVLVGPKKDELRDILEGLKDNPTPDKLSEPVEGFPDRYRIRREGYQILYLVTEEAIRVTAIHIDN